MVKSDLVTLLVQKRGLKPKEAEMAIDRIFAAIEQALVRGEHVELRGLGVFHVRRYRGYLGHNPKTSEAIAVPPKRGVRFRAGKELRDRINRAAPPSHSDEPAASRAGAPPGDAEHAA